MYTPSIQGLFLLIKFSYLSKKKKVSKRKCLRKQHIIPVPQDSFQEQARSPKLQQMHPEQMKQDRLVPTKSSSQKIKLKIMTTESQRFDILITKKNNQENVTK